MRACGRRVAQCVRCRGPCARHADGDEIDTLLLQGRNALGIDQWDLRRGEAELLRHALGEIDIVADDALAGIAKVKQRRSFAHADQELSARLDGVKLVGASRGRVGERRQQHAEARGLDVLVNNAGLNLSKDATEVTPWEWDAVMNVNLRDTFFLTNRSATILLAPEGEGASSRSPGPTRLSARRSAPCLRHFQSGPGRHDAHAGDGMGCAQHPRRRHRPGAAGDRFAVTLPKGDRSFTHEGNAQAHPPCTGWRASKKSRALRLISLVPRPHRSAVTCWCSTAD